MKTFSRRILNSFSAFVIGLLIGSLFCGGPVALAKLTIDAVEIVNANRYNGNSIIAVVDGGTGAATALGVRTNIGITKTIGITINGGGSAITTGVKGEVTIPYACTISKWYLVADQSGSLVIDVWKKAAAYPTVAETIAGTEKPTLSGVQLNNDENLTTWTIAVAAKDVIVFKVDSAATCTRATLSILITP